MFDGFPQNKTAVTLQATQQCSGSVPKRQNLIQCRQCSEQFARRTVVCPRCNRVNDRSPLVLSIKALALVLFVSTVIWVVRNAASIEGAPSAETGAEPRPEPRLHMSGSPSLANEPDVKF